MQYNCKPEQIVAKLVIQMEHSGIDSTTYWKQSNLCNIKWSINNEIIDSIFIWNFQIF